MAHATAADPAPWAGDDRGATASPAAAPAAAPAPPERLRVLLVDDDSLLVDVLADRLAEAGYGVLRAANGLEACLILARECPDLIVADLDMPVLSGFRLLRVLRAGVDRSLCHVPLVVMSGSHPQEAHEVIAAARPEAYLCKPFAVQQLLERIGELLPARRGAWSGIVTALPAHQ